MPWLDAAACSRDAEACDPIRCGSSCEAITGFIFDCDGTIYEPDGLIAGAEDTLAWLERSGRQFALLSNTGAKPFTSVHDRLTAPGGRFECRPDGKPLPRGRCYTAADAQVFAVHLST